MITAAAAEPRSAPPAIGTVQEAHALVQRLAETMDQLLTLVEQETTLVRAGKLTEAAGLEVNKTNLSRRYVRDIDCLRANGAVLNQLIPELVDELKRGHEEFRAILEINLTVLATAQAVTEGLLRGVAAEMAERDRPKSYGPAGGAGSAPQRAAPSRPIAVSRAL